MPETTRNIPNSPWWRFPWDLLLDHFSEWRCYWKLVVSYLAMIVLVCISLFFYDAGISAEASPADRGGWVNDLARGFSYWGDFLTFCVPVGALLFMTGLFMKRPFWQRAGTACLLGACFAGLTADILQFGIGRPRPRHDVTDGAYWLESKSEFHSFPSGHSATAFGSATALAVCFPPAAAPLLLGATGVAWSRLYLGAHYPSDLVMGSSLGLVFGFLFGRAARRGYRA